MKAQDLPFTQLLEGSKQFIIPIFQRSYSWGRAHCQQLWDDIVRVGANPDLESHFVGSAVYIPETKVDAAIPRWLVIDGQQRITTLMLLLIALKRRLQHEGIDDPVSAEQVDDLYLRNRYGKGEAAYRMLLARSDREALTRLVDEKEPADGASPRILENFSFFDKQVGNADLSIVWAGIKKLMIVDVCLQQGIDNPQMIFESMNSTGKALTQADLIRNYVLMGLEPDRQASLYLEYWQPMENQFGNESYIKKFDEFMRYFLVAQTGNDKIRKDGVYEEFRALSRSHEVEGLLALLREYAEYYCRIALGGEDDNSLAEAFHDIREQEADVCYPMLMEVYRDFRRAVISKEEFLMVIRMVESYVFRRAVCDIPTNSRRQTFATFMRHVKKDRYIESVKAAFLLLPSYRRFPSDDEFVRQIQVRNMYKFNRRSYWLRRFENHGRKERVQVQDYTIEHIMPQNPELSSQWRDDLGEDWKRVHEEYLHTLGNLTLTGYNSEYSDKSFSAKRDMKGGFRESPLKLNRGLCEVPAWNEAAICSRATRLAAIASEVWEFPFLAEDVLLAYKPTPAEGAKYSRSDHPNLRGGRAAELFDALENEILALDECVTEHFLKLYIAFKAESNFVDVIPQAQGLILNLSLEFNQVDDPRGLCRDVSNIGTWGNGDVNLKLTRIEDLNYAVGLIRQALDRQLGDAGS